MRVYVTRRIPEAGFDRLRASGLEWRGGEREEPPSRPELLEGLAGAAGVLAWRRRTWWPPCGASALPTW